MHRDPVMIDLARHEREEALGEQMMEMAQARAKDEASDAVGDDAVVRELIYEYEVDPSVQIARCIRNLDSACRGEKIGIDALTTAVRILQDAMISKQTDNTVEKVYEELRGWR